MRRDEKRCQKEVLISECFFSLVYVGSLAVLLFALHHTYIFTGVTSSFLSLSLWLLLQASKMLVDASQPDARNPVGVVL